MNKQQFGLWFLLLFSAVSLTSSAQETAPEAHSISADELKRDVVILASDEMGGRLVGTPGNELAAEFITSRFHDLQLKPVGTTNDYLYQFDLIIPSLGETNTFQATIDGALESEQFGQDFFPELFSATNTGQGGLVFVGFGISAPDLDHDDYGNVDVSNRVVLILDHEPEEWNVDSPFDGTAYSEHSRTVRKVLEAQKRGAAAVLVMDDIHNHRSTPSLEYRMSNTWTRIRRVPAYQLSSWVGGIHIPVMRISVGLARRLLTTREESLESISQKAERDGGIVPIDRSDILVNVVSTVSRESVSEHSVLGLIEGMDPAVSDEWIIISAHYDHEGTTPRGTFYGADDNASGVAGLIEIAEAYSKAGDLGVWPRRSILFAAWNAEEQGLLGSWAYTEAPLSPLHKTVAVINMDMIGRNEEIPENGGARFHGLEPQSASSNTNTVNILGYSYSEELRAAAEIANVDTGLKLRFRYDHSDSNLLRRI